MEPLHKPCSFLSSSAGRLILFFAVALVVYHYFPITTTTTHSYTLEPSIRPSEKVLVVASLKEDDTSWVHEYLPDWEARVYVADDSDARFTVQQNKGRESNVYLTYIIDNYDKLPNFSVFIHGKRYQWHNEDPMYDGVPIIKNLQLSHVHEEGYANLRCTWGLGCPAEIVPQDPEHPRDPNRETEIYFAAAFKELFPGEQVPNVVGLPCGSQMALSKDKIRERPREDYIRYRTWLWNTTLPESVSGRVLEYAWHMIMGKPAVHCPHAGSCFCQKFGLCNLTCQEDRCEGRYRLPPYSTIPDGWPLVGPGTSGWPEVDWWVDSGNG